MTPALSKTAATRIRFAEDLQQSIFVSAGGASICKSVIFEIRFLQRAFALHHSPITYGR